MGVLLVDINIILLVVWGFSYVNDFVDWGWIKWVYVQVEVFYWMLFEDMNEWYVCNGVGDMVFFGIFFSGEWIYGL